MLHKNEWIIRIFIFYEIAICRVIFYGFVTDAEYQGQTMLESFIEHLGIMRVNLNACNGFFLPILSYQRTFSEGKIVAISISFYHKI